MRYESCMGEKIYTDLASWANMQQFFMSMSFSRFREIRANRKLTSQFKNRRRRDNLVNFGNDPQS